MMEEWTLRPFEHGRGVALTQGVHYFRTPNSYVIEMDVPGLKKSEIQTEVDGSLLRVTGRRGCPVQTKQQVGGGASWMRASSPQVCVGRDRRLSMYLPPDCDAEHGNATLADGVLTLKFPALLREEPGKHRRPLPVHSEFESEHVYYTKVKESAGGVLGRLGSWTDSYLLSPAWRLIGRGPFKKAQETGERLKEQAQRVYSEGIRQPVSEGVALAGEKVREQGQRAGEYAQGAGQKAGEYAQQAQGAGQKVYEYVQESVHRGQEAVEEFMGGQEQQGQEQQGQQQGQQRASQEGVMEEEPIQYANANGGKRPLQKTATIIR